MWLKFCQSNRGLVWALSLLGSHSFAQEAEVVEWEFLSSDGVVERRPQPEPQEIDLAAKGLPLPITVESEVLGSGSGKIIKVEQIVSEGVGGNPFTGNFDMEIGDIVEGPDGHIWVSTRTGLCRYDSQAWILYTGEDGLHTGFVQDMEFDKAGHLWLSGTRGVAQFDGQQWIWHPLPVDTFRSITVSPNGDIWTGGGRTVAVVELADVDGPFLYRFDGTNWWEYSSEDGLPIGGGIENVDVDQAGVVWTHTISIQPPVVSFDGTQFVGYRTPIGLNELFVDSKNQVWIGMSGKVLVKKGAAWNEYPRDEDGNWGGIRDIFEDKFTRLWFGGSTWGVLEGTHWSFHPHEELNATVSGFLIDRQGFHWVSLSRGSNRLLRWLPGDLPTTVKEEQSTSSPMTFELDQNHPNPFNASTQIRFDLPSNTSVQFRIYNLAGQLVATLIDAELAAGSHQIAWDGRDAQGRAVASGLYLYRLQQREQVLWRKMVLLR